MQRSLRNLGKQQAEEPNPGQGTGFVPGPEVPALPLAATEPIMGSPRPPFPGCSSLT